MAVATIRDVQLHYSGRVSHREHSRWPVIWGDFLIFSALSGCFSIRTTKQTLLKQPSTIIVIYGSDVICCGMWSNVFDNRMRFLPGRVPRREPTR